jgi:hypothetical protein
MGAKTREAHAINMRVPLLVVSLWSRPPGTLTVKQVCERTTPLVMTSWPFANNYFEFELWEAQVQTPARQPQRQSFR